MNEFQFYSPSHIAALAIGCVLFAALIISRKAWRKAERSRAVKRVLGIILIVCELSLQLSYVWEGEWSVYSLPFQLCSLTLLISAAAMLTDSKRWNSIIFYLGVLGALQALATPNLAYGFPHFRYFHFFIAHIGIIAAAVIVVAIDGYRPKLKSVGEAILWLHILAIPAAVANAWSKETNFMFLARKPDTASMLDLLAPWPWYLLQLEGIALLLCLLLYGVMNRTTVYMNKRRNR